jgi:peptidoglycan/xylan/chitin deacetylase (PgdA/CDA1 family)
MFVSVTQKVKNGSIVLFHNDVKNTPKALDQILKKLGSEGYSFVLVKDLIYSDNYTIDSAGQQIKKS